LRGRSAFYPGLRGHCGVAETVLSNLEELLETKLPETVLQRVKTTNVNPKLSEDEIAARLVRDRLKLLFPSEKYQLIRRH
jgi:hypothetical protein